MIVLITIVRDELDMSCWIDYHLTIGFDKIFIWDDHSKIPIEYKDDRVIIEKVPDNFKHSYISKQTDFYEKALANYMNADWVACLDGDEYVCFDSSRTLKDILNDYIEYGSLSMNWLAFGSNWHDRHPAGRVFDNYTKRAEQDWAGNKMFKPFFQPKYFKNFICMHQVNSQRPNFTESGEEILVGQKILATQNATSNTIWCNHYYSKSRENWETKMTRGDISNDPTQVKPWEYFDIWDRNEVEDYRASQLYYLKRLDNENLWNIGKHNKILQKKAEFLRLVDIIKEGERNRILEIGTNSGGATTVFCNLFKEVYSVDIKVYRDSTNLESGYKNFHRIIGDSQLRTTANYFKLAGLTFDVLMIDGSHTLEGLMSDFFNYKDFVNKGGLIIIHDILFEGLNEHGGNLKLFWDIIKQYYEYEEIINITDFPDSGNTDLNGWAPVFWGGIGVLKV